MEPIIILAGGFGTRLSSILNNKPKPMADINGTPFIELLIKNLIKNGFDQFILSLHYKSKMIIDYFNKKKYNIKYVVEPKPLGTGGAVSYAIDKFSLHDYIYILNGDTWMESGYSVLKDYDFNTISVVNIDNTSRYGKVELDKNNRIIKFLEKNNKIEKGLINSGFYKLNSRLFKNCNNEVFSIENDIFPQLVEKKELYGKKISTKFTDIGVPEDYYKFCKIKNNY
tara:strand:+ start:1212 stop:1889 length:678 start_codon:yes stop_codon:yes gene_type:complete